MSSFAKRCRYCRASEEAYRIDAETGETIQAEVLLCVWADEAPEAAEKLVDVPIWLQQNSFSGHLMKPQDCSKCAAFKAKDFPSLVVTP